MAKQSSFSVVWGWRLKALGLVPRSLRPGRHAGGSTLTGAPVNSGCHGDGMEPPTSLPASEAEKK